MEPRVIEPGGGESTRLYAVRFTFKLTGEQSGGALALVEVEIPPRTLIKPHRHAREDEFSLVLSGSVGYRLADQEGSAEPGTYLVKPRGVPHAIWNTGEEPARILEMLAPGGFERYFQEVAPILKGGDPDGTAKFYALAEAYGVTIEDEWVEQLEQRYGVRL
jgi:quercetin dioxygenase-like cupin family protein